MQAKMTKKARDYKAVGGIDHVLLRPDTYGGSITEQTITCIIDGVPVELTIVPMLYKIFDEILVNAIDNHVRGFTDTVKITVGATGFTIWNNGKGVPVEKHPDIDPLTNTYIYTPELVFFRLRSGQNFDDSEDRFVGGRNGYGSKLTSIFSTKTTVTTGDKDRGLKFKQVYENNMKKRNKPKLTKATKDFTEMAFEIDLEKFSIEGKPLDAIPIDVLRLMEKRAIDAAATNPKLKIYWQGSLIKLNWKKYVEQNIGNGSLLFTHESDYWKIGVAVYNEPSKDSISFVNNVWTKDGGSHVNILEREIRSALNDSQTMKKNNVTTYNVLQHLRMFVSCMAINPTFNSQMKDQCTLPISKFKKLNMNTDQLRKKLFTKELKQIVEELANKKNTKQMKRLDGSKKCRLNIVNLTDATKAGTSQSRKCSLIVTEGLSALNLALAGLSVTGNQYYGCFPLRGKILNGYRASHKAWADNKIIQNVVQIFGLKHGVKYTDTSTLRYGSLIIMSDQDSDGFHIRGLVLAIFGSHWPELLNVPGFIRIMKTPLVKAFKRKKCVKEFFDEKSAIAFQQANPQYQYKYYKGLGTSTNAEAKEYFSQLDKYVFNMKGDIARFRTAYSNDSQIRKDLSMVEPRTCDGVTFDEFVDGPFSNYIQLDNIRKIPSSFDGFKLVQRKILWTFMVKCKEEIKVAQAAGIVANFTGYHHGEENISNCIIKMAQRFVGSNNLPLLKDIGQYGSRYNPNSAAASRYIYTMLEEYVKLIFREEDHPILEKEVVDGKEVEPKELAPIIPMLVVNGSVGIGTGWSCSIPTYTLESVIDMVIGRLDGTTHQPVRGFKGFTGDFKDGKIWGKWHMKGTTLHITEIPLNVWIESLEAILIKEDADFEQDHTNGIHFIVHNADESLIKKLQLVKPDMQNWNVFQDGVMKESSLNDVIQHHFDKRLFMYEKRKTYQLQVMETSRVSLLEKIKFLEAFVQGFVPITTSSDHELHAICADLGLNPKFLDLPMRSLQPSNIKRLKTEMEALLVDIQTLQSKSSVDLWKCDLMDLKKEVYRGDLHNKRGASVL
jgi:DNA topoisomerase-2